MPVPGGYSQSTALQKVRRFSDESLPSDADVIGFLNDALEELCATLNPVKNVENIAVNGGEITVALPSDAYNVDRITWSNALPTTAAVQEYPLTELDPGAFDELSGGLPTLSGGVPGWYRVISDMSNVITIQIYVAIPSNGFINVYESLRPTLWDPANGNSVTNVDSSLQLLAVYKAVVMVCENRENFEKAKYFRDEVVVPLLAQKQTDFNRRTKPKGARVRDVMSGPAYAPVWMKKY